ncbi:iron dependent repressor [Tannerella sp. oral taxon 808]|nr:iron dependent repressor [Tannerella sp. oral taxon 808]
MKRDKSHIARILATLRGRDRRQEQEAEEDLLKAIYEQGGSLAADEVSHVDGDRTAAAVGRLVLRGELTAGECLQLTDTGREHALRIVRAHRIYEQYLAEHSGYAPAEWHERADHMEHRISDAEQERIVSLLRNPLFDPHGDPIPTRSLEVADRGDDSHTLRPHSWWRITHVEDDNRALFTEIADRGLTKDSVIFITDLTTCTFAFRYEGERFTLPMVALGAINMEPITDDEVRRCPDANARRLTRLRLGETAHIVGLSPSCRGALRRRLLDLGFVRGSTVGIDLISPMGNPVAYAVRGTDIALRHDQARYILIESDPSSPSPIDRL